jgi:hypothetical protein
MEVMRGAIKIGMKSGIHVRSVSPSLPGMPSTPAEPAGLITRRTPNGRRSTIHFLSTSPTRPQTFGAGSLPDRTHMVIATRDVDSRTST